MRKAESWGYLPPLNHGEEKGPEWRMWEERNAPQRPESKRGRKKPRVERTAIAKPRAETCRILQAAQAGRLAFLLAGA